MSKELVELIEEENKFYWKNMSKKLSLFFKNIPNELKEQFWEIAFERDCDNFNLIQIIEYIRAVEDTDGKCSVEEIIDIFKAV